MIQEILNWDFSIECEKRLESGVYGSARPLLRYLKELIEQKYFIQQVIQTEPGKATIIVQRLLAEETTIDEGIKAGLSSLGFPWVRHTKTTFAKKDTLENDTNNKSL